MARAMVGAAHVKVNQNRLPRQGLRADFALDFRNFPRVLYLLIVAIAGSLLGMIAVVRQRRWSRRERAIRHLLDGADALEAQLQDCRKQMQNLKSMLTILPEEMSAQASGALSADDKVQAALRDLLAHRLWIREHGESATVAELEAACDAMDQSGARMSQQLERLTAASDELARAQSTANSAGRRN
jgi:chromosome segregation ATPase